MKRKDFEHLKDGDRIEILCHNGKENTRLPGYFHGIVSAIDMPFRVNCSLSDGREINAASPECIKPSDWTYTNPFYSKNYSGSRPEYTPYCIPSLYKGYAIYERVKDCFDVVKNGVIVSMRAGINGAKSFIDSSIKLSEV